MLLGRVDVAACRASTRPFVSGDYAGIPAGAASVVTGPLPVAFGRNRIAKRMNTTSAPAEGTSQIECQSWVTLRHSWAAAAASVHEGLGVANRLTTAPDAKAPMK